MSEEEKQIMNKMIYCNLINGEQALKFNRHIKQIQEENKKLHSIIKEAREVLENKREKMTNQLLYVGCCDYEELLYQVDEEIGRILDKVEENK